MDLMIFILVEYASGQRPTNERSGCLNLNCRSQSTPYGENFGNQQVTEEIPSLYLVTFSSNLSTRVTVIIYKLKNYSSHRWIRMGTANNERVIDITKIYERLGELTCKSILGFHASTGCDHNPAFFNKGNKRPFSILKKKHYQEAFAALGDNIEKLCPSALQPQEHGWIYDEDKYFLKWFDGGQLPGFVAESVQSPSESISDDENVDNFQNWKDFDCCIGSTEVWSSDEDC
ncbi:hypothetical protein PV325_011754 [Microctonus aethiopoides]|nr:hypothetical protein PV325_011754 [Microctonus aethiopoides]